MDARTDKGFAGGTWAKEIAEQTELSSSALGNYEASCAKDGHYTLYQACKVPRCDRRLSTGPDRNKKSPKRRVNVSKLS